MFHKFLLAVIISALGFATAVADVPPYINFQGFLTDNAGAPVADGNYSATFSIYDSLSGGNLLWQETQSIATVGGKFTAELGTVQFLDQIIFSEPDRWLGIEVGADPEISPRTRLSSVPHSFKVGTVDGATGGEVTDNLSVSGYVGIGTTAPASPLEVFYNNIVSTTPAIAINNTVVGGQDVIDFKFSGVTQGRIRQANGGPLLLGTVVSNHVNLITNNTVRMTVSNLGNVGIGTINPTAGRLVVDGGNLVVTRPDLTNQPNLNIVPGFAGTAGVAINALGNTATDLYLQSGSGNVGIGTTSPAYRLEVSGPVMMEDAVAPSAAVGHAGIYSSSGELFALDAAGNSTLLSPHDSETGEWIFYSKNLKTGRVVRIDMERLVRKFEEITGEKFITEKFKN